MGILDLLVEETAGELPMEPAEPGEPRTERAMMPTPTKVMARTRPADRVTTTKAMPNTASGAPNDEEENSDQVRLVNGSADDGAGDLPGPDPRVAPGRPRSRLP